MRWIYMAQAAKANFRDHIFYFSYMQPAPKGDVLDLWANAEQLAVVNGQE